MKLRNVEPGYNRDGRLLAGIPSVRKSQIPLR